MKYILAFLISMVMLTSVCAKPAVPKHGVVVPGSSAITTTKTTASAQPLNWFEQIIQTLTASTTMSLTGTIQTQPAEVAVPVTPRHHHTIHKKHRHSHHAHTSTPHVSVGGMKSNVHSHAHTKLFEEFEVWRKKQLWEDIIHGRIE